MNTTTKKNTRATKGTQRKPAKNAGAATKRAASTRSGASKSTASRSKSGSGKSDSSKRKDTSKGTMLEQMFVNMLKDIYWAEQHLLEKLDEMREKATTDQLQDAFEDHMLQTKKHVSRLEKVFRLIDEEPEAKKCDAMEGLTKEASEIAEETEDGTMTRDAALIIAAQKVEHYEIATYGSLVQIALTLGHDKAADLLEQTLWEEEDTDSLLTEIAETYINPMADDEDEEAEGEEDEEEEEDESEDEGESEEA